MTAVALRTATAGAAAVDRTVRRRIGVIWALLWLNVLSYGKLPMIIPIPSILGKAITQGALWLALGLAVSINRRAQVRPNAYLSIVALLAGLSLVVSVHTLHLGSSYRGIRLVGFVAVLWLLTPWFGRRDMLLLRCHLRCLVGVIGITVLGTIVAPGTAYETGRLQGDVWPIPASQLAHYAAVAAGLGIVLWLTGLLRRNRAILLTSLALLVLILSHSRTALVAMIVAVLIAAVSLFLARRRARRALTLGTLVLLVGLIAAFPLVSHWFLRGESTTLFTNLSGRTLVWHQLVTLPRHKFEVLFGSGLSNKSFEGLSIDNSWLAAYQDQGLVGDVLVGLFMTALVISAVTRPPGSARALALFLITYCLIASYTEVGLGDASSYLLDLSIAASLIASIPVRRRPVLAHGP